MEYLGVWVTRDNFKPINKSIEAITNLELPTSLKQVQKFVAVINYYRNIWSRRSHTLTPLTRLLYNKCKCKWTQVEQDAFDKIKQILDRDNLLTYPDFNKTFKINNDANAFQLGAVISHKGNPIYLSVCLWVRSPIPHSILIIGWWCSLPRS